MKPTLVILAAGMASRYGSMKQTEGFGPTGETIMEYSIYDAINAGFGKVVFIIREDFADAFKAAIEPKLTGRIKTEYAYQSLQTLVDPSLIPADRVKPWGTGHAVLCAEANVNEPFAVINADDFYGADAFGKANNFLTSRCDESTWAIIGYQLSKTLSDNGTVSRGVCATDDQGNLISIVERTKLHRSTESGQIVNNEADGSETVIPENAPVSMNFMCFHPSYFKIAGEMFQSFLRTNTDLKGEFFLPLIVDAFRQEAGNRVKVVETDSDWFGVTYKEDAPHVKASLYELIENKEYPESLWG